MGYYFSKDIGTSDVEINDIETSYGEINDIKTSYDEINEFCNKDDFEDDSLDSIKFMFQVNTTNLWIDFIDYFINRISPVYYNRNLSNEEKLIIVSTFFNSEEDGGNEEARNFFYKIMCNSDGLISSKQNVIIGRINKFMNMSHDIMDNDIMDDDIMDDEK